MGVRCIHQFDKRKGVDEESSPVRKGTESFRLVRGSASRRKTKYTSELQPEKDFLSRR